MIEHIVINGIPHWRDETGLALPIMAGGQWGDPPATTSTAQRLIGVPLYNTDQTYAGTITQRPSGRLYWSNQAPDGTTQLTAFTGGSYLTGANEFVSLDPQARIISARDLSLETAGSTGPAWSSTQQAAQLQQQWEVAEAQRQEAVAAGNVAAQRQYEAEQDDLRRQWEADQDDYNRKWQTQERIAGQEFAAEQNVLAEEATLKRQRLSTLTELVQSFVQSQSQARDTLANLQPDPFRFAAVAGGVAPFGVTPQQGFQTQLQQYASATPPAIDANASPEALQGAINQLIGVSAPTSPAVFGAAGGANFSVPLPGEVINAKVGERGPEFLRITSQGVEVIPQSSGMTGPVYPMAEGGTLQFPYAPISYTPESMLPALTTSGIFSGWQGGDIPRGALKPDQSIAGWGGGVGFPRSFLENLGIQPKFIQQYGRPEIFYMDPSSGGQFRLVTNTAAGGTTGMIQPGSVTQVADIGQYGTLGSRAIDAPELTASMARVGETPSPFERYSAPIFERSTGVMLPAPYMVLSELNKLRLTNPTAFNLLLNAYQNSTAEIPPAAILNTMQQGLPFGTARGPVGLA